MRLANELNDPTTLPKTYWPLIKILVNGLQFPVIPPIVVNNKPVTNFKDKANIFNDLFSKQCQSIPSNSTLSLIQTFEASNRMSTTDIDLKKLLTLIQGLNCSKPHGHYGILIRKQKLGRLN